MLGRKNSRKSREGRKQGRGDLDSSMKKKSEIDDSL